jgi:hypothetical protein
MYCPNTNMGCTRHMVARLYMKGATLYQTLTEHSMACMLMLAKIAQQQKTNCKRCLSASQADTARLRIHFAACQHDEQLAGAAHKHNSRTAYSKKVPNHGRRRAPLHSMPLHASEAYISIAMRYDFAVTWSPGSA